MTRRHDDDAEGELSATHDRRAAWGGSAPRVEELLALIHHDPPPPAPATRRRPASLMRLALVFVVISGIASFIVVREAGGAGLVAAALTGIHPWLLALAVAALLFDWATDTARYVTVARAMGERLSMRLAVAVMFANLFFAYLTPGGGFGAPAVTYMLYRRGTPLPKAIAIALVKPFLSMFALIPTLLIITAFGGRAFIESTALTLLVGTTGGIAFAAILLLFASAVWPGVARKAVDGPTDWFVSRRSEGRLKRAALSFRRGVHGTIDALALFVRSGPRHLFLCLFAAFLNIVAMCAIAVALLYGFGAEGPQARLWGFSLLYVAMISVAPTPGGSGIAEGGGYTIFASVLPGDEQTGAFVLLWRLFTCYLPLLVGLILFARFLKGDTLADISRLGEAAAAAGEGGAVRPNGTSEHE